MLSLRQQRQREARELAKERGAGPSAHRAPDPPAGSTGDPQPGEEPKPPGESEEPTQERSEEPGPAQQTTPPEGEQEPGARPSWAELRERARADAQARQERGAPAPPPAPPQAAEPPQTPAEQAAAVAGIDPNVLRQDPIGALQRAGIDVEAFFDRASRQAIDPAAVAATDQYKRFEERIDELRRVIVDERTAERTQRQQQAAREQQQQAAKAVVDMSASEADCPFLSCYEPDERLAKVTAIARQATDMDIDLPLADLVRYAEEVEAEDYARKHERISSRKTKGQPKPEPKTEDTTPPQTRQTNQPTAQATAPEPQRRMSRRELARLRGEQMRQAVASRERG